MAVTLKVIETDPTEWPAVTRYPRAAMWEDEMGGYDPVINAEVVWRMIERWCTTRWPSRAVVYFVEGPGEWGPRLSPYTATATERWTGTDWEAVTLRPSPLCGYDLDGEHYRITGTAGDGSAVPEDVQEAWRRLHSYILGNSSAHLDELGDPEGAPAGKALRYSGAADLLRPYRRLA